MSTVAIILLNYNSTRLTKKCVKSLQSSNDEQDIYHIVIWDNDSVTPPVKEEFANCDVVLSKKNLGYAQGNNKAVAYALKKYACQYVLILNNDTRVTKGMIRRLIETYETDSSIGMVVPKIYFEKGFEFHKKSYESKQLGKVLWYAGGGIDWNNVYAYHKGIDEIDRGHFDIDTLPAPLKKEKTNFLHRLEQMVFEPTDTKDLLSSPVQTAGSYDTTFATGCCFLISTKFWKNLGGFDKKYFLYYEDTDLSMRLLQKQKRIVFEPRATLYHLNAGSSDGGGSSLHQYYQTRNRLRFGMRYARLRTKIALLLEAKRMYVVGTKAVKLGILHALEGRWGNQTHLLQVQNKQ